LNLNFHKEKSWGKNFFKPLNPTLMGNEKNMPRNFFCVKLNGDQFLLETFFNLAISFSNEQPSKIHLNSYNYDYTQRRVPNYLIYYEPNGPK